MRQALLLFADERGQVYDHPQLLAAARSGDDVVLPFGDAERIPEGGRLAMIPGRRPVGIDPATGRLVVLREVKIGRKKLVPHAVGAVLPPGWTRTLLPAGEKSRIGPVLPQWAYTAAGATSRGPVAWAIHTDRRKHWSVKSHSTQDLAKKVEARLGKDLNPLLRQLSRCALEWHCFTAQNTFYGRDEGAIPASSSCNAACIGCISEQDEETGPPASHERMELPPSAQEMAALGGAHLEGARGRVMVSFGQGCEGEPLVRWREILASIRTMRARTGRGSINMNTNGSLPDALAKLVDAGLDAVRISLNSASPDLYAAYYRPVGYSFADVERSMKVAHDRGAYLALNLLTFPGVTDREGEADRLCRLVERLQVDQVQTRSLAIDPDVYMEVAREHGGKGSAIGMGALLKRLKRARRGLVIGNFARALSERSSA
jgi:pyruvate-formate lyase-activating enzyme